MKNGFTILEIVIVLGIIGILIGITALSFSQFQKSRALTNSADTVISVLNEARSRTLASVDGERYGVFFTTDRVVLFSGDVYNPVSTTNEDFLFTTPVTLQLASFTGGTPTVLFERLTGNALHHGTIILQMDTTTRTLTLLSSGIINQ